MFSETVNLLAMQVPPSVPPVNPPPGKIPPIRPITYISRIGTIGHTAQWVAFALFALSTVSFATLGTKVVKKNRIFHILTALITGIATLTYYAMATRSGSAFLYLGRKVVQGREVAVIREISWVRYVDWALTTPLILLVLGLLAGLPWLDIFTILVIDEGMVITGLVGGFKYRSTAKWGWFAFSCIFLLYIVYTLLVRGRQTARLQANHVSNLYTGLSIYTILVWVGYPIVFALASEFRFFNPNIEAVVYAILDVMAKSVFGLWLIFVHKTGDEDHAATMPDHWIEPRSHHRGIHLPGSDD